MPITREDAEKLFGDLLISSGKQQSQKKKSPKKQSPPPRPTSPKTLPLGNFHSPRAPWYHAIRMVYVIHRQECRCGASSEYLANRLIRFDGRHLSIETRTAIPLPISHKVLVTSERHIVFTDICPACLGQYIDHTSSLISESSLQGELFI